MHAVDVIKDKLNQFVRLWQSISKESKERIQDANLLCNEQAEQRARDFGEGTI